MERLFDDANTDEELTSIIGETVYKPWDCLSGIYQIEINGSLGLVARPDGVTKNNCIIIKDTFMNRYNDVIEHEIRLKLMTTMAVWKAAKGVYVLENLGKVIFVEFSEEEWKQIYDAIKEWAKHI